MNARLRLLAWQIDVMAHERARSADEFDDCLTDSERVRGHVAKWEGGGLQNRYERVRFSPWPHITTRFVSLATSMRDRRRVPRP